MGHMVRQPDDLFTCQIWNRNINSLLKLFNSRNGEHGKLGHHKYTPKKVEALAGEVIVDVACGWRHALDEHALVAVTSTGSIYTWGDDGCDNDDNDHLLPTLLLDLSSKGVLSVSAGRKMTACVTEAGEVFTWGDRQLFGHGCRLGGHRDDERDPKTPKLVEALIGVKTKQVSCGWFHTAVCTEDGRVYTFGRGVVGGLGHHGDEINRTSPSLVAKALEGKHITQVQCGFSHIIALTSSGYVFTWGSVDYGQLGHGNKPKRKNLRIQYLNTPCLVEGLCDHNVVQITSGYSHCAVIVVSVIRQSQQASFNNKEQSDIVFMVENERIYANIEILS